MMINDFVLSMNKLRLSTPVVFEMENSQLLQDTARQICILCGIIPYPVRPCSLVLQPRFISAMYTGVIFCLHALGHTPWFNLKDFLAR